MWINWNKNSMLLKKSLLFKATQIVDGQSESWAWGQK